MIEIFKAITQFVKSDFNTSGGVTALSAECRLRSISVCLNSHGGVAGTNNRLTVFHLKPIFSRSGAMRMPNVGIWLGFGERKLWILGWRPYCKLDCSGMSEVWGNTVYSAFFAVCRVEVHWLEHTYLRQVRFWRHRGIAAARGSVSDPIYVRFSCRTIDNAAIVELRTNKRSIEPKQCMFEYSDTALGGSRESSLSSVDHRPLNIAINPFQELRVVKKTMSWMVRNMYWYSTTR